MSLMRSALQVLGRVTPIFGGKQSQIATRRFTSNVPGFVFNCPPTKITQLPNGMRVATEENFGETATVGVWIDAGSAYETPENNGVAHFLEHMAFKGTGKRTRRQLELEIESIGAQMNAYTGREQTVYYAKVAKPHIPAAVDVLSDILTNATLSEQDIEHERSVITREFDETVNKIEEYVFDQVHAAAFQGTPYGWGILGPKANILNIKRNDLVTYIKNNYTASRMVLVGAGAVKHEELVELATKKFSGVSTAPSTAAEVPHLFTGSAVHILDNSLPLAHIVVATQGVGWSDPDYFVQMAVQVMLGSWDRTIGAGSHLSSHLCEKIALEKIAHSVNAFNTCYRQTGLIGVHAVTEGNGDQVYDLVWLITSEFPRIANEATAAQVERAKNKLKAAVLMELDGTTKVAEDIGRQLLSLGRRLSPVEVWQRIDSITPGDVRRFARDRMTDVSPVVVGMGPTEGFPDYNQIRGWTYWNRV